MKISCIKNDLTEAVLKAERFIGKNLTLPILMNILLEAGDKTITVTATNLEMGIRERVPCKKGSDGAVSIPARIFSSVLQSVQDDIISLEEKNATLSLSSDSSHYVIHGVVAKEFPILPSIAHGVETSLPIEAFTSAITQVLPAVSLSDIKPELSGVYVSCDGGIVKVAATDSFRLAERTLFLKEEKKAPFSFILPQRTAHEIVRCFSGEGDVDIVFGDNQVSFSSGPLFIISSLIDGAYHDYQQIIPKNFSSYIHIGKNDLISAVKGAAVVSSRLNDVTIGFYEDRVEVMSVNPEVGKTSIMKKAKVNSVGKISFNYRYLLDGIYVITGSKVSIGLQNENSAVLIQGTEDQSFLYVLMPIRAM